MPKCAALLLGTLLTAGFASADWLAVQSIQPGAPIMVRSGFISDAGKFVSATPDAVVVETRTGQSTIAKDEVDEVFVIRSRSDRARRALLFGGIAAGGTAAVLFPAAARLATPRFASASAFTAANGVAMGAISYSKPGGTKRIYRKK